MSENIQFVSKVKPVFVDATGREVRAPFLSVPFTEDAYPDITNNLAIDGSITVDILANIITTNNDLFVTGFSVRCYDASAEFGRTLNEGFILILRWGDVAGNRILYYNSINLEKNPPVYNTTLTTYDFAYSNRFNPVAKIPYNATSAAFTFTNYSAVILDRVDIFISYFELPYAT